MIRFLSALAACALAATSASAEDGWKDLFNGKDLSGWTNAGGGDPGKGWEVKDGALCRTGKAGDIWSKERFGDFTLELEFKTEGNSGVFIRKPQLQCRDYLVAGPYKDLKQYKPQEWNQMVVEVKDGVAHCTCNGEVLEAALALPPTGPIGLEGDRGVMEYRHIQLKELP